MVVVHWLIFKCIMVRSLQILPIFQECFEKALPLCSLPVLLLPDCPCCFLNKKLIPTLRHGFFLMEGAFHDCHWLTPWCSSDSVCSSSSRNSICLPNIKYTFTYSMSCYSSSFSFPQNLSPTDIFYRLFIFHRIFFLSLPIVVLMNEWINRCKYIIAASYFWTFFKTKWYGLPIVPDF